MDDFNLEAVCEKNAWKVFCLHFVALFTKRVNYFKRDKKGLFCEILLPCIVIECGLAIMTIQFIMVPPPLTMNLSVFGQNLPKIVEYGVEAGQNAGTIFSKFDSSMGLSANPATSVSLFDANVFTKRST